MRGYGQGCISLTHEHYERLVKLHQERGVTYDVLIREALEREIKRQADCWDAIGKRTWQL